MILGNVDQANPIGQAEATNDTYPGSIIGGLTFSFVPKICNKILSFNQTGASTPACLPVTGGEGDSFFHNIHTKLEGKGSQQTAVS